MSENAQASGSDSVWGKFLDGATDWGEKMMENVGNAALEFTDSELEREINSNRRDNDAERQQTATTNGMKNNPNQSTASQQSRQPAPPATGSNIGLYVGLGVAALAVVVLAVKS